jgi:hypothetical protein
MHTNAHIVYAYRVVSVRLQSELLGRSRRYVDHVVAPNKGVPIKELTVCRIAGSGLTNEEVNVIDLQCRYTYKCESAGTGECE